MCIVTLDRATFIGKREWHFGMGLIRWREYKDFGFQRQSTLHHESACYLKGVGGTSKNQIPDKFWLVLDKYL